MQHQTTGVFYTQETSGIFSYQFSKLSNTSTLSVYTDVTAFAQSRHTHKVACLQIPYPYDYSFDSLIDSLYDICDDILILGSELHEITVDAILRFDKPKIKFFLCGYVNVPLKHCTTYIFADWFTTTVHFYKHVKPDVLTELTPYKEKPYNFDILLGRKKFHRDYAYEYLHQHSLVDNNIVTYINSEFNFSDGDNKWIWESKGLTDFENVNWTVDRVCYYGHNMSLSQVIPISVYNQTAYSVIAETGHQSHYTFFTEKTVKPMLGQRMFIALSGANFLSNLRKLGFKTFNGIIDESYDTHHEWDYERWKLALDQLAWVCQQDQSSILAQVKPITEHNFNLLMDTDWHSWFRTNFERYFPLV